MHLFLQFTRFCARKARFVQAVDEYFCNQQNFLLRSNGYKIKQCLPGAHVVFKEAVKDTHDDGRPKNGLFVAVPAVMKEYVEDISPNHWRVQAVLVRTTESSIIIINTYFPTDPKSTDFDSSDQRTRYPQSENCSLGKIST